MGSLKSSNTVGPLGPEERDPNPPVIAVVIPCYRVKQHVTKVIEGIGDEISLIYCVDDECPEKTGAHIQEVVVDKRVRVLYNETNLGVGGATIAGYRQALADGATVIVKLDGDGQMDPGIIPRFVDPILRGVSDYTKGNRFYRPEGLKKMPPGRLLGNAILSFLTKLSSGYWDIFDPTNGFTAIHRAVLQELPLDKISRGYFFESDMLFRLNTIRAVVTDVPMVGIYGDEESGLRAARIAPEFLMRHIANFFKRFAYNYFLRDFHLASVESVIGAALVIFGVIFGTVRWIAGGITGPTASAGTVMLAALPVIIGFQMILAALNYDVQSVPRTPVHGLLPDAGNATASTTDPEEPSATAP